MPRNRKLIKIIIISLVINLAIFGIGLYLNRPSIKANSPVFFNPPAAPVVKNKFPPFLTTPYYLVLDPTTNTVLLGNLIQTRIYPASITKLATALTALNLYPLDEVITTTPYKDGKVMELKNGEKVTARTLISALLVYSANDAAFNLARHYQLGENGFINEMNNLVAKYKISNTHFTNYDGIHNQNHFSTLYDLSQLARLAISNPFITDVVKNKAIDLTDISGNSKYHLVSTNELLGIVPELEGLKTGWTPEAGGCFIGLVNLEGHKIITVVAQSQDRFADTKNLITWAKNNLSWQFRDY